jgi:hypothetical protein
VASASPAVYIIAALATFAAVALPFLAVRFPPITDLPQQAAQIRLASEVFADSSPYRLNLLAPGALSYGLFAVSWWLAGAEVAGRLAYVLFGGLWIGGFTLITRDYDRDPAVIPLTGLFFFSHVLYWGFTSFLFGAVGFLVFLCLEKRLRRRSSGLVEITILTVAGLALYSSHLFWFAASALWLITTTSRSDLPVGRRWLRVSTFLPALAIAWIWQPQLRQSGFQSVTAWGAPPWARLSPGAWTDRLLGGLEGPVEPLILGALILWLLVGLWQHRKDLKSASSPVMLLLAGTMILLSLLLPHRYQNTLNFAERWAPVGAALLLVALPTPRMKSWLRRAVALILVAGLSLSTTAIWKRFEDVELSGLSQSLAALPEEPRLLGLDFYRLSRLVKTQPFFQNPAYSQVLKGGSLGFSFASFPSSPVVYREWKNPPWTPGLEWFPQQIIESIDDIQFFDSVLVHTDANGHEFFERQPALEPVTSVDRWRLYRVVAPAPSPAGTADLSP